MASLRLEERLLRRFEASLAAPHAAAQRRTHARGVVFGIAQSMPFFAYATCLFYGGHLVDTEGLEYKNVFR